MSYVHNHLQLLSPDKSRTDVDDRYIIATDRDRIDVELEPYIVEEDIIMDLNRYLSIFSRSHPQQHSYKLYNSQIIKYHRIRIEIPF